MVEGTRSKRGTGTPKEPYRPEKRALQQVKRDLLVLVITLAAPKEPYRPEKRALRQVERDLLVLVLTLAACGAQSGT